MDNWLQSTRWFRVRVQNGYSCWNDWIRYYVLMECIICIWQMHNNICYYSRSLDAKGDGRNGCVIQGATIK